MFQPKSYFVILLAAAVLATLVLGGAGQGVGAQVQSFSQTRQENTEADPGAAPNAFLSETFHDMGTAKVDETVSYQFVVENKGSGVLRIKDVAPG